MSGSEERTAVPAAGESGGEEAAAQTASGGGRRPALRRWVAERRLLAGLLAGLVLLASGAAAAWLTLRDSTGGVLTARVERRVLDGSLTTRGTVTAGQTAQIVPRAGDGGAVRAVVTKLPVKIGETVAAGRVLVEISGRPVFALPGALPAYRDLRPGARGADVTQLQQALRGLGLRTGSDRVGEFGPGTSAALTALYTSRGCTPLPAQSDAGVRLAAAQDAVTAARRARQDALDDVEAARAQAARQQAGQQQADGQQVGGQSQQPLGGGTTSTGTDRATLEQAVAKAQRQVSRSEEDLTAARSRLAAAKTASGPMLPAAEVLYLQGFPAVVRAVPAGVGSVVDGSAMTVSADGLVVRGGLPAYQKGLVRPGQSVRIVSEADRVSASGTVVSVADAPTGRQPAGGAVGGADPVATGGTGRYPLVVRPNHQLDPGLTAQDVLLTVEASPSRGRVLAVPTSAITVDRDGRTVVTVRRDGSGRPVVVLTGTSGGGWTEIRPVVEGAVREGDRVVVGSPEQGGGGTPGVSPAATEPAAPEPAAAEPGAADPAVPEPAAPEPTPSEPASAGRAPGQPKARLTPQALPARPPRVAAGARMKDFSGHPRSQGQNR